MQRCQNRKYQFRVLATIISPISSRIDKGSLSGYLCIFTPMHSGSVFLGSSAYTKYVDELNIDNCKIIKIKIGSGQRRKEREIFQSLRLFPY